VAADDRLEPGDQPPAEDEALAFLRAGRAGAAGRRGHESWRVMLTDGRPSPEQLAIDAQLRRDIAAEIRALSPKLRDALLLAQSGDHRYDEIAAMLGTATGKVKWRVSEARRLIKIRLRERGYADVG